MSQEAVEAMQIEVETLRPACPSKRTNNNSPDEYDTGMRVPTSVLDMCLESFTAADEKRMKANTAFFADTGLMALLCRHDNVLWLANMTTAGERQFYALALLQKLFENIPIDMTIGALYDVGCHLDRSCNKWDFLTAYLDRITFGISVFHAYGHQWPCQLIYHPRKCMGFGLSDGEGCERFWSSIKHLIPSLRVTGYHRRLYCLDMQVRFLHEKSLFGLGKWLDHKWRLCLDRKNNALATLDSENINLDYLRSQWQAQVKNQTKPLARK